MSRADFEVGKEISLGEVTFTYEMCRASGLTFPNWHNDKEIAIERGLPEAVVAGPHLYAITATALERQFGEGALVGGGLSLKFVRPVFVNEPIVITGLIRAESPGTGGELNLEVSLRGVEADIRCIGEANAKASKVVRA